ncbi:MAG TPA: DUF3592 domain-containing protein [Casimicrobiaceae bacterium]|nr:DUF3592 domain-containing protein [Casimicrobiaceae bacterium]
MSPGIRLVFGAVGVFAIGLGLFLVRRPMRLRLAGGRAKGTVESTRAIQVPGRYGVRTYHLPTIVFVTAIGERVTFESAYGGRSAPSKGEPVDVHYDPANAKDAEVASPRQWLPVAFLALFGLPFLLVGILS